MLRPLLLITFALTLIGCKNLHEVHEGNLYRSAQLSAKEFAGVIDSLEIKTIINLRGENPGHDWWEDEVRVAAEKGVAHINIGMSAKRFPHKQDLVKLLDAYRDAERPILIHCAGGADRTGEASAIYKMLYLGTSKKEALKQLTLGYGHIAARFPAKRAFIKLWQDEEWARSIYDPCEQNYGDHYEQERNCHKILLPYLSPEEDS